MAVVSLLLNFNWTTIALVYSDEEPLLADALLKVKSVQITRFAV